MSAESIAAVEAALAATTPATDSGTLGGFVNTSDAPKLRRVFAEATALVGEHLGTPERVAQVPAAILVRSVLNVGSELFHAQDAPGGVANFGDEAAPPVRLARDPLVTARPILARYAGGGFA